MLYKTKSSVQEKNRHKTEQVCSPQNWTSVFMNQNSVGIPSLFTYIKLKVPSGSILTTRANLVFKSSISNWRFSQAAFSNRTECVFISQTTGANPVFNSIKTQNKPICHRIKQACLSIKLVCSLSLWLYPSYWTESSTKQRYTAKLRVLGKLRQLAKFSLYSSLARWLLKVNNLRIIFICNNVSVSVNKIKHKCYTSNFLVNKCVVTTVIAVR